MARLLLDAPSAMPRVVVLISIALGIAACGAPDTDDTELDGPRFPTDHPRIYLPAHKKRLIAALDSGSPAAKRFVEVTDRWVRGDEIDAFPAWHAALLGQLRGDSKYCTAAVAAVDKQVKDAVASIARGDAPRVAGDSYLEIGDLVGDLALVYDWCHAAVGDRKKSWLAYGNHAVANVWNHEAASWGGMKMPWSGWATDDPSDNYYYSFLRATMLLGLAAHHEAPEADRWLKQFRDVKLGEQLLPTFDADLAGGGSREGTGYGVSMRNLFELYDLWHASTGENLAGLTPHTRASMLAFIHSTLPTLDRVAPTGDHSRDSTAALFDYHRHYAQQLIALFPSDPLAPRLQALLAGSTVQRMGQGAMAAYDLIHASDVEPTTLEGLGTAYYAPGTGQLYARSGWNTQATWLNFIAGPYTQSHAHQDQGALMLYKDGWLAYDAVVESHSGLRQEVGAHGTLRIMDGGEELQQQVGTSAKLVALHRGDRYLHAAADLTPVYAGAVSMLHREVVFLEPDCIVIFDRARTPSDTEQIWQLVLPVQPSIVGAHTEVNAAGHVLTVDRIAPASASGAIHDFASGDDDFSGGFRLEETASGGDRRWLHVVSIDRAATAIRQIDATTVEVTLASGTVRVKFDPDTIGATLTRGGQTIRLAAGVDALPE
ncbi:MAG: hypothetical protein H0T46_33900 [Deltaproteobacteria bacterium]|nr:hypothetical protein [Deltaproteobacteria bacterium]